MPPRWQDWVHVTKLDPDRRLPPGAIDEIATSGTDALMLSGTLNVTRENLAGLRSQVSAYGLPLVIEPAGPECALQDGIDLLFVPSVMNTTDVRWIVGTHHAWVLDGMRRAAGSAQAAIAWDRVVQEAYIVLNPDSAVGRVTRSVCDLSPESAAAYAAVADRYFCFPIVYVEYSGTYGDPAVVEAVRGAVDRAVLYYGGGIRTAAQAAEMARFADTVVVGNAVYEAGPSVLRATVRAAR
ncbi:MAG: phosphoglycerol geranylgeranyltransferase [Methanospirillum sp.]|nr:phosphoglycerol geranylgeranyltransferase [Methanospirillum sp.]